MDRKKSGNSFELFLHTLYYLSRDRPPYCCFVSSCPRWSRPKNITLSLLIYDPFGDPRTKLKTTLFFASIFLNLLHSVILCILLFQKKSRPNSFDRDLQAKAEIIGLSVNLVKCRHIASTTEHLSTHYFGL